MKPWIWLGLGAAGVYLLVRAREAAAAEPADALIGPSSSPSSSTPRLRPEDTGPMDDTMLSGTDFARRASVMTSAAREAAALAAALRGNVPSWARTWKPVPVAAGALRGTVYVSPDFWSVGTDSDWVRWPVLPATAERIADASDAMLPTRKLADAIHAAADLTIRLPTATTARDGAGTAVATSRAADVRIGGRTGLVDGHRKNILVADAGQPGRIVIYGAVNPDTGAWPLQPYSWVHSAEYRDYSHGARLVRRMMDVDGRGPMDIRDVMRDRALAPLVSDRATDRDTRYGA